MTYAVINIVLLLLFYRVWSCTPVCLPTCSQLVLLLASGRDLGTADALSSYRAEVYAGNLDSIGGSPSASVPVLQRAVSGMSTLSRGTSFSNKVSASRSRTDLTQISLEETIRIMGNATASSGGTPEPPGEPFACCTVFILNTAAASLSLCTLVLVPSEKCVYMRSKAWLAASVQAGCGAHVACATR